VDGAEFGEMFGDLISCRPSVLSKSQLRARTYEGGGGGGETNISRRAETKKMFLLARGRNARFMPINCNEGRRGGSEKRKGKNKRGFFQKKPSRRRRGEKNLDAEKH